MTGVYRRQLTGSAASSSRSPCSAERLLEGEDVFEEPVEGLRGCRQRRSVGPDGCYEVDALLRGITGGPGN